MEYFAELWTFVALYTTVTIVMFLVKDPHNA